MVTLLDVNVLIALIDTKHQFHGTVSAWWATHRAHGWASCPLTQNGCIRIVSQPKYPADLSVRQAIDSLAVLLTDPQHHFWPDNISILENTVFDHSKIHSPAQLTDLYLLALAIHHGGRMVTLDRAIPLSAVRGTSSAHLIVL